MTKTLLRQFDVHLSFLESLYKYFIEIEEKIVSPIREFKNNLSKVYDKNLSMLNNFTNDITDYKEKLSKTKYNYYYESELLEEIKEINEKDNQRISLQEETANKFFNEYQEKIKLTNQYYSEKNLEYDTLYSNNVIIEEGVFEFLKKICIEATTIHSDLLSSFQHKFPFGDYLSQKDLNTFKENFNFINHGQRLQNEEIITYDKNKIKYPKTKPSYSYEYINSYDISDFDIRFPFYEEKEYEPPSKSNSQTINSFLKQIFDDKDIDFNLLQEFKSRTTKIEFISKFFESYIKSNRQSFYTFKSKYNFDAVAKILCNILTSFDFSKNYLNQLNSFIFICESSYLENDMTYLCMLLGENEFFKVKDTWKAFFENILVFKLKMRVEGLLKEEERKNQKKSIISSLTNYLKNNENNTLISNYQYNKKIKNYISLTDLSKSKLDNEFYKHLHETFKEFIEHLCNFNYEMEKIIDIVMDFTKKFSLSTEWINYFVIYINAMILSARRKKQIITTETQMKIKDIKNHRTNEIILKYPCKMERVKEKVIILINTSQFLSTRENVPLLYLNNKISKEFKYHFYSNLIYSVKKNLKINNRLAIWRAILGVTTFIKNFNYKKISEDAKSEPLENETCLIDLDLKRTNFFKDKENSRKATSNILLTLFYVSPNRKYYQGMNYIASFLYQLCDYNEADAFGMMYSLLINTEYSLIFDKDLTKLKSFFYAFDRLLQIYLPSLAFYFKYNSVLVHYYLGPWIITLFTNILQHRTSIPLILLTIWDEFLLKGWKTVLNSILAMISLHKKEIESKSGENLLTYLINDLVKTEKFNDENFEKWKEEKKKFKIKNKTIKAFEEEEKFEFELKNNSY